MKKPVAWQGGHGGVTFSVVALEMWVHEFGWCVYEGALKGGKYLFESMSPPFSLMGKFAYTFLQAFF